MTGMLKAAVSADFLEELSHQKDTSSQEKFMSLFDNYLFSVICSLQFFSDYLFTLKQISISELYYD